MQWYYSFSLKQRMPVFLLLFSLLLIFVTYQINYKMGVSTAKKREIMLMQRELHEIQGTFEAFLHHDDYVNIDRVIANISADEYMLHAILADEQDRIVASASRKDTGMKLQDLLTPQEYAVIKEVRSTLKSRIYLSEGTSTLIGVYPIHFGSKEGELRTVKTGIYWSVHDFGMIKQEISQKEQSQSLATAALFMFSVMLLALVVYIASVVRLEKIMKAADAFAKGDMEARSGVMGKDEVGELAQAFDTMIAKVATAQKNLLLSRYEVEESHKTLEKYLEVVDENVITSSTDKAGIITSVSEAFCNIAGYTKEELIGKRHNIVRHEDMPGTLYDDLWKTIQSGHIWHGEIKNRKKDGDYYWVDAVISPNFNKENRITGYTAIRQDITDKKRIEELSITDELTTLYNRRYFNQRIIEDYNRAHREKKTFAFMMFDVDNFKKYNDYYGHQKGDVVLKSIGILLKNFFKRSSDCAFRLGGEEFGSTICVESASDAMSISKHLCRDLEAMKIEHEKNDASRFVTASFGITIIDFSKEQERVTDMDVIYRQADEALYRAKENGRNQVVLYGPETI